MPDREVVKVNEPTYNWCSRMPGRTTLIQLVPQHTGEPNGVAAYALELACALRTYDIDTVFLSGTPEAYGAATQDKFKTVFLPRRQSECLADAIQSLSTETDAQAVLLHFSGYGYQKRGVPFWLVRGLRHSAGRVALLSIFHELYATTGRPWHSSFWLSPLQKQIARDILYMSSEVITATELHQRRLLDWNRGAQIRCMPVFSNVGEPGCGSPPCARAATAVVFGLAGVEHRIFGLYRSEIERIVMMLGIERVIDIGPRRFSTPTTLAGVPLVSKGVLPRVAVSELLQHARVGFVAYPFDALGKSGVFAAYAAHGIVPVVFSETQGSFDGLEAGRHFLDGFRLETSADGDFLAMIQRQLFNWYASHCLQVEASFIERSIRRGAAVKLTATRTY